MPGGETLPLPQPQPLPLPHTPTPNPNPNLGTAVLDAGRRGAGELVGAAVIQLDAWLGLGIEG